MREKGKKTVQVARAERRIFLVAKTNFADEEQTKKTVFGRAIKEGKKALLISEKFEME
jgi:hypothetical protein